MPEIRTNHTHAFTQKEKKLLFAHFKYKNPVLSPLRASTYPEMGELLKHQRVVLRQAAAVATTALAVHVILDAQW